MTIEVGTFAIAKRDSGVCKAGEVGVCYEVYALGNRPGYGFIFEQGGHDGFSIEDVEMVLELTQVVVPSIADYRFTNVGRLVEDYRAGRFAEALAMQVGSA